MSAALVTAVAPKRSRTVSTAASENVTLYDVFVGRADAVETIEIRARVSGFLGTIDFEPSELVEAGSTLSSPMGTATCDMAKSNGTQSPAAGTNRGAPRLTTLSR